MILIKDLDPLNILNSLTAEDGFKQDVKDSILNLCSSDKQVGAILDHLETQTDDTFGSFVDILREQYKHLHRVLVETSRTLDETDDDRTRERAAMIGDSVRKLLRHTARHQMHDQLRRGSSEFLSDYYVDNLRNDGDDAGQYIDCYVIPTRGKLQKEKWIKHVASSEDQTLAAGVAKVPRSSLEVILTCDVAFKLIDRCDIPKGIEQPPKMVSSIYGVRRKENEEKSGVVKKESAPDLSPKQNEYKTKPVERSRKCPPPLPPKPDILSLSGKKLLKSFSLPQGNLSDLENTEKTKEVPNLEIKITPPPLISDAHDNMVEKMLAPSPLEQKVADFSAPPLPVRQSLEKSDDARQVTHSTDEKIRDLTEVRILSTPPLPIRRRQVMPENQDHKTTSHAEQEVLENGVKSTAELSGDEDDDDDVSSLNFDVGIQDQDDVGCDVTSPTKIQDAPSLSIITNGSGVCLNKVRQASPVFVDTTLLGNCRTFQADGKRMDDIGLDESIPVDVFGSFEGSHYEEIEPHGEGFSLASTLYLDPRSDKSLNRQSTRRRREHRNGIPAFTLNQLKTFDSPSQMLLTKGTFLIVKNKVEISAPNTEFDKTYLGYDSMGLAYYIPIDSVKEYGDPRNEKWFYPIELTAKEATLFLNSVDQNGCFVVYRPSDNHDPLLCYRLSVSLGGGVVLHYDITENVHGDVMIRGHDHSFMNVCDLVEYFCKNRSNLATRLRRPLREGNLPITPGYHYCSRFEIQRREVTLSSVMVDRGMFGDYCLGVFKGISVRVSVMKTEPSASNDDDFLEEGLMMMMMMEHENIIRLLGVSCSVHPFYVVMEHIDRGTLAECLQHRVIPSDNIDSLFAICIQMVAAMNYLESLAFMLHRSLSSQSFYVTEDLLVKLGKFDRARHVVDDNYQAPSNEEVIVRWAAPEVLSSSTYSTKSDVWSLGVVLWEVFSQGACPYASCGVEQVALYVTEGGRLEKPPQCAPDLWSMMKNCWKQHPGDRPTFAMLQDKIKGKSSIYYVSPVRSNPSVKNLGVVENGKLNGSVPSKSRSSLQIRSPGSGSKTSAAAAFEVYKGSGSADGGKKRSKSATRGMLDRIDVPDPAVRNGSDRAQTPSSDSSSIISASVLNDSCDDLVRGQKPRKSWKKLLK